MFKKKKQVISLNCLSWFWLPHLLSIWLQSNVINTMCTASAIHGNR